MQALLAAALAVGCPSVGTVRPPFRPLPEAFLDTLAMEPAVLLAELASHCLELGFAIEVSSELDRYLETRWFNLATGRPDDGDLIRPDRVIRLRFWIDPLGPLGYQVTSEVVYRRVADPSLPDRESELMVPPGHEGEQILVRILDGVKEQLGR